MSTRRRSIRTPSSAVGRSDERFYRASQWQIIWWKFRRHRIAVVSAAFLLVFYRRCCVRARSSRPTTCTPATRDFIYAPPQARASLPRGQLRRAVRLSATPTRSTCETLKRDYTPDAAERRSRSASSAAASTTSFWGLFDGNLHLICPPEGGTLVPARHRPARPRHALAPHLRRAHLAHHRPGRRRASFVIGIIARRHRRLSTAAGSTSRSSASSRCCARSPSCRCGWRCRRRCR